MVPIGNFELGHLLDTLRYLATLTPKSFGFVDNLLLDHVGLPHVLDLAVHLVIFLAGWVGGIVTIGTFLIEHSNMLKSYRVVGGSP